MVFKNLHVSLHAKTVGEIQIFKLFLHSICDAISGSIWNTPLYTQTK